MTLGRINATVTGYSDANFAACLVSGPIEWGTKPQVLPATTTAVAEIVATEKPIRQWIRNLLQRIRQVITNQSLFLYIDNSATISFLNIPINSEKTRHVATKYKYEIKRSEAAVITYEKVHTSEIPADIGTKVLLAAKENKKDQKKLRRLLELLSRVPFFGPEGSYGCPSYWEGGRALSIGQIG